MLAMTETLHTGVQSIESKIRSIAQAADSTPESVKCLQNLFITDPAKDRAKLITSKGELVLGTCDWITQRKEFLDWQASNGGLLWISGGPGLGKTMLSIYLTEYLSSSFRPSDNANGHLSMYFFCDAKDNTRNNAAAILRGLLFQLLEHDMELIKHILPSYQVQQERLFEQNSLEGLWGLFLLMVNSLGDLQVTCVLDGLDECEPVSLETLLTKIKNITSTAPRLRMIILSREYPECLGTLLGRFLRVRLDPDAKTEVSAGLEQYISTRVAELSESRQYPAELAFHVKQTLRAKSAGTYLWVSFVIKDLQTMELSEVEESLDKFPRGLEALYERILEQIEPTRRDTTLDILRWSTFAVRPLSLTEMAGALGIQPTEHLDRVTVLRGKLAYCGHLINTANDVVTLVHQSAYDFLTRRLPNLEAASWYSLSQAEIEHSKLASTCISYFSKGCFEGGKMRELPYYLHDDLKLRGPFFRYAGFEWNHHFELSGQHGSMILDACSDFFSDESRIWKAWLVWRYKNKSLQLSHLAARLGLTALVQRIIKEESSWLYLKNALTHRCGTPLLHIAAKYGQVTIVDMLIKNKAQVNAKDGVGNTPLHLAARQSLDVVKMLVENGAHIDSCNNRWRTPLCDVARDSKLEVAEYLLKCGANVNGHRKADISPLKVAVLFENPEMVKLLLGWGADSRTRGRDGPSSNLAEAIARKPRTLIVFLEDWAKRFGSEPSQFRDRVDFGKTTALEIACEAGNLPAIRLLLQPKWSLDVNHPDYKKDTPLHLAAKCGNLEAVKLLLAQPGIDPTLLNRRGWDPLLTALLHHHMDIVQYLVDNCDLSISEPDGECRWGPMHFIICDRRQQDDLVFTLRLLIDKFGFNPRLRTPLPTNPGGKWHEHARLPWSEDGIPQESCHELPLSFAIQGGNVRAVKYFLTECGIDPTVPCRGCDGATPLHVAAHSLQNEVVDLLISEWKVNVNAADDYQRTPLHIVSQVGDMNVLEFYSRGSIVRALLKAGAQISARDIDGYTARDLYVSTKTSNSKRGKRARGREFDRIVEECYSSNSHHSVE
jgi:ankyrin repeat protein